MVYFRRGLGLGPISPTNPYLLTRCTYKSHRVTRLERRFRGRCQVKRSSVLLANSQRGEGRTGGTVDYSSKRWESLAVLLYAHSDVVIHTWTAVQQQQRGTPEDRPALCILREAKRLHEIPPSKPPKTCDFEQSTTQNRLPPLVMVAPAPRETKLPLSPRPGGPHHRPSWACTFLPTAAASLVQQQRDQHQQDSALLPYPSQHPGSP